MKTEMTRKHVRVSEYDLIKAEVGFAKQKAGDFFHENTAYKVIADKTGRSIQTIQKIARSKDYNEFYPPKVTFDRQAHMKKMNENRWGKRHAEEQTQIPGTAEIPDFGRFQRRLDVIEGQVSRMAKSQAEIERAIATLDTQVNKRQSSIFSFRGTK